MSPPNNAWDELDGKAQQPGQQGEVGIGKHAFEQEIRSESGNCSVD